MAGITFLNMLLGELVPKRIALVDPEKFAVAVALPMRFLTWVATPVHVVLIGLTRMLLRLLRMNRRVAGRSARRRSACSSPKARSRA